MRIQEFLLPAEGTSLARTCLHRILMDIDVHLQAVTLGLSPELTRATGVSDHTFRTLQEGQACWTGEGNADGRSLSVSCTGKMHRTLADACTQHHYIVDRPLVIHLPAYPVGSVYVERGQKENHAHRYIQPVLITPAKKAQFASLQR